MTTPDGERWAVVLGASAGSGAAIARAVVRDPGLNVFGAHRGHYADAALSLEREVATTGRRVIMHVGDVGHADGVLACADVLASAALALRSLGGPSGMADNERILILEEARQALGDEETALRARVLAGLA